MSEVARVDLAVVGAGPAGMAAAAAAAGQGRRVWVLDEGFRPGGQIWRHRPGEAPPGARRLLAALAAGGVQVLGGAGVFDAWRQDRAWRLAVSTARGRLDLEAPALVLACGARERFAPFPGWTLPGVLGAGGRTGAPQGRPGPGLRPGAGGGQRPPLLPVAAAVRRHGGRLLAILEQAPWRRVLGLAPRWPPVRPRPCRPSAWGGPPWAARTAPAGGWPRPWATGAWSRCASPTAAERACCPAAGCSAASGWCPTWSWAGTWAAPWPGRPWRWTGPRAPPRKGIYAAGEVCGIAGLEAALAEGRIAGLAAAGAWDPDSREGRRLARDRGRARAMGRRLEDLFAPRDELLALPRPDTLVCRCEDVPFGAIDPAWDARETKLCTRAGMGPVPGAGVRAHPGPALRAPAGHGAGSAQGGAPGSFGGARLMNLQSLHRQASPSSWSDI